MTKQPLGDHGGLDARVRRHADDVLRIVRGELADELDRFSHPRDYWLPMLARPDDMLGRVAEVGPGRFYLEGLPPLDKPSKGVQVFGCKALMKRCEDGEFALLGWEGHSPKGRSMGSHSVSTRAEVPLHIARVALAELEKRPRG